MHNVIHALSIADCQGSDCLMTDLKQLKGYKSFGETFGKGFLHVILNLI